jgi:hypothetical protein
MNFYNSVFKPFVKYLADHDKSHILMTSTGMDSRGLMVHAAAARKREGRLIIFVDVPSNREYVLGKAAAYKIKDEEIRFISPLKLLRAYDELRTVNADWFIMMQSVGGTNTQTYSVVTRILRSHECVHLLFHAFRMERHVRLLARTPVLIVPARQSSYFYPLFGDPNPFGLYSRMRR